jgi:uncharacterized protein
VIVVQPLAASFWGRAIVSVEWRKLCHLVYDVDPALLASQLPPGLSLDLWETRALVELVLWNAKNLKVLGVTLPAQLDSTEVALRYLVREGPRHGYVPVAEDSSSPYAALAARALFKDPTRHMPASGRCEETADGWTCSYQMDREGAHHVHLAAASVARTPAQHTLARFAIERPYAYVCAGGGLLRHDLSHAPFQVYEVREHAITVDFGRLYGERWAFLNGVRPLAVVLAEGGAVQASLPE